MVRIAFTACLVVLFGLNISCTSNLELKKNASDSAKKKAGDKSDHESSKTTEDEKKDSTDGDTDSDHGPVADAGSNQTVSEGDTVTLDATASTDQDSDQLTYSWSQEEGPSVGLSDPKAKKPTFTAPNLVADDVIKFQLTVSDGTKSSTDSVKVEVSASNEDPVADAGSDLQATSGDMVTLDGSASADPEGQDLSFTWTQTEGPSVSLSDASSATPSFQAPPKKAGTLTFELTVGDGNSTDKDQVNVVVPVSDVKIAATRVAAPDGNTMQDITISGFGTPKAALFILTEGETNDGVFANARMSMGATDGTRQWTYGYVSAHNAADTQARKYSSSSAVAVRNDSTNSSVHELAEFDQWITDGVRLNWTTSSSATKALTVIFFGGDDLQARADTLPVATNLDEATHYTKMGFEADLLISGYGNSTFSDGGSESDEWNWSYGFVQNTGDSGVNQVCFGWRDSDDTGYTYMRGSLRDDCGVLRGDSTGHSFRGEFADLDQEGFDLYTRDSASYLTGDEVAFLGLKTGNRKIWVDTLENPATTGSRSITSPGFEPQFAMLGLSAFESLNTGSETSTAGSFSLSVITPDSQYAHALASEDGAAITNSHTVSDSKAVNLDYDDGSSAADATLTSFDPNGWTLNYSSVPATTTYWIGLAIEESTP